jgi:hypothetical protein
MKKREEITGDCPHCLHTVSMVHLGQDVVQCKKCKAIYEISRAFKGLFTLIRNKQRWEE